MEPPLALVWPDDSKFTRRCFRLLKEAHVKSRYCEHYKMREDELEWLFERVAILLDEVKALSEKRFNRICSRSV